jgi:type II secretory pathway component PulF
MPLIITPKQLCQRSEFYYQLSALTKAGVALPEALETLHRSARSSSFRRPLASIIASIQHGFTLSESLQRTGSWLPEFDIALVEAGERSGRLDAAFQLLSEYYRERAQLVRNVLADLAYPLFIFHFAFLILPIGALQRLVLRGDVVGFLGQKLVFFLPLYGAALFLVIACQGRHGERWRSLVERAMRAIPILGSARQSLALARLAAALEALLNAGVSIVSAWDLAASASGSPALKRSVHAWRPKVLAGQTPAEVVRQSPAFPELFANLYHTGEVSGQLDDALLRLHHYYQEEGSRKLKLVAQWGPWLVYLTIILVVAYQIIAFWMGYFQQISAAAGF